MQRTWARPILWLLRGLKAWGGPGRAAVYQDSTNSLPLLIATYKRREDTGLGLQHGHVTGLAPSGKCAVTASLSVRH